MNKQHDKVFGDNNESTNQTLLDNVYIVLCNTSHTGNIGSTARAMKTMGLTKLILVNPINKPDDHSIALASSAVDVIESAQIVNTLDEAIHDVTLAIALTSRNREFCQQIFTPQEIMPQTIEQIIGNQKVAFVFGAERNGLTITQLEKCNRLVTIPGNPKYFSLNLSQAVQIICYELYIQYSKYLNSTTQPIQNHNKNKLGTFADNQGVLANLDRILTILAFCQNKNPERVQRNLQHIIHKASLVREEVDLLRGILNKIEQKLLSK